MAIDGKTLRHSFDTATGKSAIHMVSAWATANHISLGQVVVDAKSNEITAIPQEIGHGRDEHRTYMVCDAPADLPDLARWKNLKRIGIAISETIRDGKTTDEVRYDILNRKRNRRRARTSLI